jgi:hypothetical protein
MELILYRSLPLPLDSCHVFLFIFIMFRGFRCNFHFYCVHSQIYLMPFSMRQKHTSNDFTIVGDVITVMNPKYGMAVGTIFSFIVLSEGKDL